MLSRRARFAIAAVLDVARLARGRPLPMKALASIGQSAPRQFEPVLQELVRNGLLRSVRGPHGGYELARERRRISLGDVVRAMNDAEPATAEPALAAAIDAATTAFLSSLDQVTIEDLLRDADVSAPSSLADFHI